MAVWKKTVSKSTFFIYIEGLAYTAGSIQKLSITSNDISGEK
jgi:hypothetical protein